MAAGTPGSIGGFVMDVTVLEDHVMSNDVTEDPVEEGAPMTDHIRRRADMLTLQCAVTDHPMGEMVTLRAKADAAKAAINSIAPVATTLDPYGSVTEECRAYMTRLMEDCEPVVVVTSIRTYDSMALVSFRESRSPGSGAGLMFTAELRKIRIVSNERTSSRVAVPRAAKKQNRGHLPAVESVDDAEAYLKQLKNRKPKNRPLTDEEVRLGVVARDKIRAQQELERYKQANADWAINPGGAEGHF